MLWVGACYKETLALCAPESDRGPWSWKKEIGTIIQEKMFYIVKMALLAPSSPWSQYSPFWHFQILSKLTYDYFLALKSSWALIQEKSFYIVKMALFGTFKSSVPMIIIQ